MVTDIVITNKPQGIIIAAAPLQVVAYTLAEHSSSHTNFDYNYKNNLIISSFFFKYESFIFYFDCLNYL